MARGLPAVWSAVFGGPLIGAGVYLFGFQSSLPIVQNQPHAPPLAGLLLAAFGCFVVGLGAYVRYVGAPEAPRMREAEEILDQRDPAQRNALAETFVSMPILGGGGYLLYFTERPLVYPTVALAVGFYLFSRGIHRYWRNTLTTYYVTNQRVLEEYRFVSLVRDEVPLQKVRGVQERRTVWESLFGLGHVAVRSGAASGLTVSVDGIYDPTEFADLVRDELAPEVSSDSKRASETGEANGNGDEGETGDELAAAVEQTAARTDRREPHAGRNATRGEATRTDRGQGRTESVRRSVSDGAESDGDGDDDSTTETAE
ncbi:PH domain-containing protein [Halorussus salinus]|uniref:PH domain-containing protein n=1 Tax=Halorussus salinus TaxID=1364935 RepID=UPI001092F195|nr:PH domain-containing protein [Halorussus salinus]